MPSRTPIDGEARRGPGGRGAGLSAGQIVEAAIELMDSEGTSSFTVRALARRLGVESAALYWHFSSKDEICRAVVETIGSQLGAEAHGSGTPREQLTHHLAAIRKHWLEHPSALELSLRFPPTAAGDVVRAGVALVETLGVPVADSLDRYRALVWSVNGFVILEQRLHASKHHRLTEPGGRRWLVQIDDGDDAAASEFDTDVLFQQTIDLLLDGLMVEVNAR